MCRETARFQQAIQRLAVDGIDAEPWLAARDHSIEPGAIEVTPFGGESRPIDRKTLGPVDGSPCAQDRLIEIDAGTLQVEGESLDALKSPDVAHGPRLGPSGRRAKEKVWSPIGLQTSFVQVRALTELVHRVVSTAGLQSGLAG